MAVAEASFKTSMERMSCGLMVLKGLLLCFMPKSVERPSPMEYGMPSTTYKGSVLVVNEFAPRIWILIPAPGAPSD